MSGCLFKGSASHTHHHEVAFEESVDSRLLGAALPLPSLSDPVIPLVPSPLPALQPALAFILLRLPLHPAHPAALPGDFPPILSFRFLFGHLFLLRGFQEERSLPAHLYPSLEEGAVEFGKRWRAVSSGAFVVGADLSSAGVEERNGQGWAARHLNTWLCPLPPRKSPCCSQLVLFPSLT